MANAHPLARVAAIAIFVIIASSTFFVATAARRLLNPRWRWSRYRLTCYPIAILVKTSTWESMMRMVRLGLTFRTYIVKLARREFDIPATSLHYGSHIWRSCVSSPYGQKLKS